MVKYYNYELTFAEIPDEANLCINITNCPHRCEGCHSPFLREDIGKDLCHDLPVILNKYKNQITCVCFLGEGNDIEALQKCIDYCHEKYFHTALYSGSDDKNILYTFENLDYCKIGSYKKQYGPLNSKTTNQHLYKKDNNAWIDITYKFWPIEDMSNT